MRSVSALPLVLAAAVVCAHPAAQERPSFSDWLAGVREEALARGLREPVVAEALDGLEAPDDTVIDRDRTQAETVQTLEQYLRGRVTPRVRRSGDAVWARNASLLRRISARYGVPERIIVSVWGFESNFGRFSGVRPTIPALATLAYDERRSDLFRRELFSALEILNRGDIDLPRLKGSWAGAMGQTQFMPSSYLAFAQDFDGDGRRDIWMSTADVLASIANYLAAHGWHDGERWGREVALSRAAAAKAAAVPLEDGSCSARRSMSEPRPLADWQAMGVRLPDGRGLPVSSDLQASLVSGESRHFLVYRNYDALLEYNCAHAYALGVSLLSDALRAP
jgi:membrane-bound lytic murein transglycosylase B